MERTLDEWFSSITYRYEILLALALITGMFWWLSNGTQAFMATFTVFMVLLTARSISQLKRGTEDYTNVDILLGRIPLRYELLLLVAVLLCAAWTLAAGVTGFVLGLGIIMLTLIARSASQLKRNSATTVREF